MTSRGCGSRSRPTSWATAGAVQAGGRAAGRRGSSPHSGRTSRRRSGGRRSRAETCLKFDVPEVPLPAWRRVAVLRGGRLDLLAAVLPDRYRRARAAPGHSHKDHHSCGSEVIEQLNEAVAHGQYCGWRCSWLTTKYRCRSPGADRVTRLAAAARCPDINDVNEVCGASGPGRPGSPITAAPVAASLAAPGVRRSTTDPHRLSM
jgi:hypothetical protein